MTDSLPDPEFDLFISYVRRDVRQVVGGRSFDIVVELKRELEKHRRPSGVSGHQSRFRVCTDVDDFNLDGTFDSVMRERISRSRAFLLVSSPGVPERPHVRHELEIERSLSGRPKPLAAVLGAPPSYVAPDFFTPADIAADITSVHGVTRREWRALLRRESHKIVARVWGLKPREGYDRFEADRRRFRIQICAAGSVVLFLAALLVVGLKGDLGFHRVASLPVSSRLVNPAGVGFARDGRTPVVISGDNVLIWSSGLNQPPSTLQLPFAALYAVVSWPGQIVIAGLREVARVSIPAMDVQLRTVIGGHIQGLAASSDTIAVSTREGDLFIIDAKGKVAAPRPVSITGRRFPPLFRKRGPFEYGSVLAFGREDYIASATLTGYLGLLDRRRLSFVAPSEPQFALLQPVDQQEDPVLYETENTAPIGTVAFLPDLNLVFSERAGLRRVDTATGHITILSHCPIELVREILPLNDGRTLIAMTASTFEVLHFPANDQTRLECRQRTTLAPKTDPIAAIAPDGQTIFVAFFDGNPELWRPSFRLFGLDLPLP